MTRKLFADCQILALVFLSAAPLATLILAPQNAEAISGATSGPVTRIYLTSGTTWRVPFNWSNASNTIEAIGGGGGGQTGGGGGGGGGEYRRIKNFIATPGASISYSIGAGGGNNTNGGDTTFNTSSLIAKGGTGAAGPGGAGGAGGTGGTGADANFNGGAGGSYISGFGTAGGGGAGGKLGVGGKGGDDNQPGGTQGAGGGGGNGGGSPGTDAPSGDVGGAGGNNNGGSGGGAGDTSGAASVAGTSGGGGGGGGGFHTGGSNGGGGTEWDGSHGSGGGGGGSGNGGSVAGNGGLYGGGGGSNDTANTSGLGAQGIIVITYQGGVLLKPPNNLGLVGYWKFDEGTSTIATDFSGNGNSGVLTGTNRPTWTTGKSGSALNFVSANNTVVNVSGLGAKSYMVGGVKTISAWVYLSQTTQPTPGAYIFSLDGPGIWNQMGFGPSNQIEICAESMGGSCQDSAEIVPLGWHHVVSVWTGTQILTYIDGVAATVFNANSTTVNSDVTIGAECTNAASPCVGWDENFQGKIDEMRLYNRALSASEVAALYAGGTAGAARANASTVTLQNGTTLGPANGLKGHWTFDGADIANVIYDRSGNNRNAYLSSSVSTSSTKTIGRLGQALTFNNAYGVNLPAVFHDYFTLSDKTVSVWVKLTGSPQSNTSYLLPPIVNIVRSDLGDCCEIAITRGIATDQGSLDRIWLENYDGNTDAVGIPYTAGEWTHIVFVHTGGVLYAYKDGAFVSSTASGSTDSAGNDYLVYIGQTPGATGFVGSIDDVRFYNRALTAAEVKQLYKLGQATIKQ